MWYIVITLDLQHLVCAGWCTAYSILSDTRAWKWLDGNNMTSNSSGLQLIFATSQDVDRALTSTASWRWISLLNSTKGLIRGDTASSHEYYEKFIQANFSLLDRWSCEDSRRCYQKKDNPGQHHIRHQLTLDAAETFDLADSPMPLGKIPASSKCCITCVSSKIVNTKTEIDVLSYWVNFYRVVGDFSHQNLSNKVFQCRYVLVLHRDSLDIDNIFRKLKHYNCSIITNFWDVP